MFRTVLILFLGSIWILVSEVCNVKRVGSKTHYVFFLLDFTFTLSLDVVKCDGSVHMNKLL